MDRKSIIILAAAVGLYFLLTPVVDHFYPPKPVPVALPATTHPEPAANDVRPAAPPSAAPEPGATPGAEPSAPEQILTVSNADLLWRFTSRGGGIKDVDLPEYLAVIRPAGQPALETNKLAGLNHNALLPVLAVMGRELEGDGDFALSRHGDTIRAEKTLRNGLRVVKEFDIGTNNLIEVTTNYLFKARLWLTNTSSQPLAVTNYSVIVGTATAIGPLDDRTALGVFWYNGAKAQNIQDKWFANPTFGCFPGTPRWQYEDGASNVVWTAVHNQFFALAAMPANPADEIIIDKIRVPAPDLSGPTNAMSAYLTNGYQTALVYTNAVLQPHQSVQQEFLFYAGPKDYNLLALIGEAMGNNRLNLIMDFGVFGVVSKLLLLSMNWLHATGLPYGLTIIVITIIIKGAFWPLTNASTKSQKRMQALQPQLKAITDKYKDDPAKRNEKTMEFYKQHKVSPLGSCLPTLLQLPVFMGFYWMLRGAIELRGAHFLWAFDLSQPDTVGRIAGFPINPWPLIMGATQLWQSHMMPPSPGMDPGQQKLMRWVPLLMIGFFYRMSAGLTIYWTVSNLLSILQLRLTKTTDAAAPVPAAAALPVKKKR
jgi:YidC/Oxa1 family membrane protein insertase